MFKLSPKITQLAAVPTILAAALGLTILLSQPPKTLPEEDNSTKLSINDVYLEVELADTPWERGLGLSGRTGLAENRGMLFILDAPTRPSFWMKDMLFPIDIIWIGEDKRISEITPKLSPETYPQAFRPQTDIRYVLEVASGMAEKYGWQPGERTDFNIR